MPWEKQFDEEEAVENAMRLFWEKGFDRTSMADLLKATGVSRQSLYNALGNKRAVFVRGLLKYDREHRRATIATLEAQEEPLLAIRQLFDAVVQQSVEDPDKKGCLLVNTALNHGAHDDETNKIVADGLKEFEAFFQRLIERAKVRKEVPKDLDSERAATGLLGMFIGIRVMARGTTEESRLRALAQEAMRLLN